MLSNFQAIIFGLVQGFTELFPISSLGHSVILPRLFGWHISQSDPFFLTFLVATHAATATVLFFFFRRDWQRIISGILRSFRDRQIKETDADAKLAWLLIIGSVPAGVLGLLLEKPLRQLFAAPQLVAGVLILNGLMLFGAEQLRLRNLQTKESAVGSDDRIAKLTWGEAIRVGVMQCLALVPGFSRTGSTITGGLLVGLSHEDAARYSFLLATPIILAAAILKLPDLATPPAEEVLVPTVIGAISAGVSAYLSVKFLTRYFETEKLSPFAIYCAAIGIASSLIFLLR